MGSANPLNSLNRITKQLELPLVLGEKLRFLSKGKEILIKSKTGRASLR